MLYVVICVIYICVLGLYIYTHTDRLTEANLLDGWCYFVMLIALMDGNTHSLPFYTITGSVLCDITMQST